MAEDVGNGTKRFFPRFRQLCMSIEREVPVLQTAVNDSASCCYNEGAALLLLKDISKDVCQLKADMKATQKNLLNGPNIVKLVTAGQALLEVQKLCVAEVEAHLSQYGYTPIDPHQHKDSSTGNSETSVENSQIQISSGPDEPATPARPAGQHYNADGEQRTPTMEDYGIDPDFLKQMTEQQHNHHPSPAHTFKMPVKATNARANHGSSHSYLPPTPAEFRRASSEVPEAFEHHGLYMTPGIMGGKALPENTPLKFLKEAAVLQRVTSKYGTQKSETPLERSCLGQRGNAGPIAMMTLDQDDTMSSGGEVTENLWDQSSATFQTAKPGWHQQHLYSATDSPVAPEMTQDLQKLLAKLSPKRPVVPECDALHSMARDDNSPVPPDCLKQYQEQSASKLTESSTENSPVPPEFLLQKKDLESSSNRASPVAPDFLTDLVTKSSNPDSIENSPVPPAIVLESQHGKTGAQGLDKMPQVLRDILNPEDRDVGQAPILKQIDIEDMELPEMPQMSQELLLSLNTLDISLPPPKKTTVTAPAQTPVPRASQLPVSTSKDTLRKENVPPTPQSLPMHEVTTIVEFITVEEYERQPSYLKRQFALPDINKMIEKINRILVRKIAKGLELEVREYELLDDLGTYSTRTFFLLMSKLGRLKQRKQDGDVVYGLT